MASASSSAQLSIHTHYDVFISHRGTDANNMLASHLYHTLARCGCGFSPFFDRNEMKMGERIDAQLERAITTAAVHIPIFSENYAQSPWCLDELTIMMKYAERILPVFYDVKPSHLRRLDKEGPFATALKIHEGKRDAGKPRYDLKTLQQWRKAVSDASLRSGYERKAFNGDDGELVKNIVDDVLKRLNKAPVLDVAEHPVGLTEMAEDFQKTVQSDVVQNIRVVGIVGMGGAGKTTLAKHIFNTQRSNYDRCCFLEDVRSQSSLTKLQSKLLKDLTGGDYKIDNTSEGTSILKRQRLSSCRALVILDNIDHESQLDALLVVKGVLSSSSLIIITSRDRSILGRCGILSPYKIRLLGEQHAKELFCKHAFGQGFPKEGFEDLVENFWTKCSGLPLSLKVFGGIVKGNNNREFWECQLKKISEKLQSDIVTQLRISYDLLDEDDQEIFLDIACFFIGEDGDMAVKIWDGCGLHGLIALHTLRHTCLIELDQENRIRMHDNLRDLGRQIAGELSNKPRRLWRPADINDLVERRTTTAQVIRGIRSMATPRKVPWSMRLWSRSKVGRGGTSGLRLLEVKGESFKGILGAASRDVVWLRWHRCPYQRLPPWLSMDKLRVLELRGGKFRNLWHDKQIPIQLRELYILGGLAKFPNSIGALQNLDKIVLDDNNSLKSLPDEFCRLQSLRYLKLKNCTDLRSLPERFGNLTNLQYLDLSWCSNLQNLPDSFGGLMLLRHLDLNCCKSLMIQRELLGNISSLEHANLRGCVKLEVLPTGITDQAFLKEIDLRDTGLKELPNEMGKLKNLKILRLENGSLKSLPPSIWNLSSLTTLQLSSCTRLSRLPDCRAEDKRLSPAEEPSRGRIDHLKNLEELRVFNCPLRKVRPFTSALRKNVDVSESAGLLPNLKVLVLAGTKVSMICITEFVCPNLKHLELSWNSCLEEVEVLLRAVEKLMLKNCQVLKRITGLSFPEKLSQLDISNCGELEELPNLESMTSLKDLNIRGCGKLKAIRGASQLECLERLGGDGCSELESINGLEQLKRMEDLRISAGNVAIWNSILLLQRLPFHRLSTVSLTTRSEVRGVESRMESILNSVGFPLALFKFSTQKGFGGSFKLPRDLKSCNGIVMCFALRARSDDSLFRIDLPKVGYGVSTKAGKWINTSIFTRESACIWPRWSTLDGHAYGGMEIKKGWMVIESDVGAEGNNIFQLWNTLIELRCSLCQ